MQHNVVHICKAPGGKIAECIKRPLILYGVFKDLKAQVGSSGSICLDLCQSA